MNSSGLSVNCLITNTYIRREKPKTKWVWCAVLMSMGVIGLSSVAVADDAIPAVAVPCNNCSSFTSLQAGATSYFQQWKHKTPPGYPTGKKVRPCVVSIWNTQLGEPVESYYPTCTAMVVTSLAYPLSGRFVFSGMYDGVISVGAADNPNDAAVKDFDGRVYARSSEMPPLEIPPQFTPSDELELMMSWMRNTLVGPFNQNFEFWHGVFTLGEFFRYQFVNAQQDETYWIYVGDTIIIKYSNGWTEKLKLVNPTSTIPWYRVPNSLRDENGRVPTQTGAQSTPGGSMSFSESYGPDSVSFTSVPAWYWLPGSGIPRGTVTIIQNPIGGQDNQVLFME